MGFKEKYGHLLGAMLVFTGAVLFSCKAVIVKIAYQYGVDAVSLLALRMLFSLPFYIIILLVSNSKTSQPDIKRSDWFLILFLGIVGYYGASYFDFTGLEYITASLERLILFIYPTIVVIISSILFKRPIKSNQVFALFLTYGGIALVVLNDLAFQQNDAIKGSILIFLSAVTYAMYLIGTEKLIPLLGTVRFTAYAMIVSTVAVVVHYLLLEDLNLFNLKTEVYLLSILMAVVATVIPSFFISEGIRMIGSGSASIIGSIGPVSTIILANIFLDEEITGFQLVGTILVLAGVLIVSSKNGVVEGSFGKVRGWVKNKFERERS